MLVKIKRIDNTLPIPRYETAGAVAFDLSAREARTVPAGGHAAVPMNLVVGTPPGYMLLVAARSSLARKKSLVLPNAVGIIDQDYCGPDDELHLQVWNIGSETVTIERGERLAQGIFARIDKAEWEEADEVSPHNRGRFGTTGGYAGH